MSNDSKDIDMDLDEITYEFTKPEGSYDPTNEIKMSHKCGPCSRGEHNKCKGLGKCGCAINNHGLPTN